tara:strand:+ start:256 stop:399 length:144 start_codon:yes stop_codon:yes gene_type:complete
MALGRKIFFFIIITLSACGKKGELINYKDESKEIFPAVIEEERIYKF